MRGPSSGLVLAAGASRRALGCKALFAFDAETTWLDRAIAAQRAAGVGRVVVVVAAPWDQAIRAHVGARSDVLVAQNDRPELGMLGSLRVGLAALGDTDGPVVVSLIDHPWVRAETVVALIDRVRTAGASAIARPRVRGLHGHPIVIGARASRDLAGVVDAITLKHALTRVGVWCSVDVDDSAVLEDHDTRSLFGVSEISPGLPTDARGEDDQLAPEAIALAK